MPDPNPAALDFLLTRRSRPAKTLRAPGPDRATIRTLLTAAARSPDHGKLEPWRFMVLEKPALDRLAALTVHRGGALALAAEQLEKTRRQFADGVVAVAVIEVPRSSEKVPALEQTYSAGAVCLALLNAALAAGWGANWLTSWAAHDAVFCAEGLGLDEGERVAGFIFMGTETVAPPERPRPDIDAITSWIEA